MTSPTCRRSTAALVPGFNPGTNGRTARALFQTGDNGPLADLAASAIETEGPGAVAEVRDLIDQIRDRDPQRGDAMARAVFDRLSDEGRDSFTGGEQPEQGPIGVVRAENSQDTNEESEPEADVELEAESESANGNPSQPDRSRGVQIAQADGAPPAGDRSRQAGQPDGSSREPRPVLSPQALESARRIVEEHEEFRNSAYDDKDSKPILPGHPARGNPTVGIGFNLNRDDARKQIESLGLDYDAVRDGRQSITREQAETLRDRVIDEANAYIERKLPEKSLPRPLTDNERVALISLVVNRQDLLGPVLQAAIRRGDAAAAAHEIRERSNLHEVRGIQIRREKEADIYLGLKPIGRVR